MPTFLWFSQTYHAINLKEICCEQTWRVLYWIITMALHCQNKEKINQIFCSKFVDKRLGVGYMNKLHAEVGWDEFVKITIGYGDLSQMTPSEVKLYFRALLIVKDNTQRHLLFKAYTTRVLRYLNMLCSGIWMYRTLPWDLAESLFLMTLQQYFLYNKHPLCMNRLLLERLGLNPFPAYPIQLPRQNHPFKENCSGIGGRGIKHVNRPDWLGLLYLGPMMFSSLYIKFENSQVFPQQGKDREVLWLVRSTKC